MIRVILPIVIILLVFVWVGVLYLGGRTPRRRSLVIEEQIQRQAAANYELLQSTVRLLERLISADEVMPFMTDRDRVRSHQLVQAFYTNKKTKEIDERKDT